MNHKVETTSQDLGHPVDAMALAHMFCDFREMPRTITSQLARAGVTAPEMANARKVLRAMGEECLSSEIRVCSLVKYHYVRFEYRSGWPPLLDQKPFEWTKATITRQAVFDADQDISDAWLGDAFCDLAMPLDYVALWSGIETHIPHRWPRRLFTFLYHYFDWDDPSSEVDCWVKMRMHTLYGEILRYWPTRGWTVVEHGALTPVAPDFVRGLVKGLQRTVLSDVALIAHASTNTESESRRAHFLNWAAKMRAMAKELDRAQFIDTVVETLKEEDSGFRVSVHELEERIRELEGLIARRAWIHGIPNFGRA